MCCHQKIFNDVMQKIDYFSSYLILMHTSSFLYRYFFLVFTGLIVLGIFNGLIFLPVLLVLVGPPAEVIPNDNADAISPTTPELTSAHHCNNKKLGSRPGSNHHHHHPAHAAAAAATHQTSHSNRYATHPPNKSGKYNCGDNFQSMKKHHQSDLSLSTIAEESGSYASNYAPLGGGHDAYPMTSQSLNGANVVIEPHVVVETTTYPSTHVSKVNNIGIYSSFDLLHKMYGYFFLWCKKILLIARLCL